MLNFTARFRIDAKLWKQFRKSCKKKKVNPSEILRIAIEEFLHF